MELKSVAKSRPQVVLVAWILVAITDTTSILDCNNCVDGKCNFKGECLKGCVPGFVDILCKEPCPPNCINTCHLDRQKGTYVCSDGCKDGFCGSSCKLVCPNNCTTCDRASCSVCDVKPCAGNHYGAECVPCPTNYEKCDMDTGQCIKCKKGFYGENCEKSCPRCLSIDEEMQEMCETGCDACLSDRCPQNCNLNLCKDGSGSCLRGCKAGFHGARCDVTCNDACAEKTCVQENGSCIHGCIQGYQETETGCKVDIDSYVVKKPILIVIGLTCFILLMTSVTICSICIYRRHSRIRYSELNTNEHIEINFTGRATSLESLSIDEEQYKAEAIQRKTTDEIAWRTMDMVSIAALSKAIKKFEEDEYKWITITGNPGDGKTTLACMIMQHFQKKMDVFKLDSPDDYRHITWKKRNRMILLDDIFGAFTSDESSIQRWIPVLRSILENHELNQKAKTYDRIILASRKNVAQDAQRFLERYGARMLEEDRVIDLHKRNEQQERQAILDYHLEKRNVDVDSQLKEETVKLETSHGFPYCCKVYSELRAEGKDIDIVEFFKSPLTFLNETTKVLLKSTGSRLLFRNMLKDEKFDIDSVEDDRERQKMLVAASAEEGSYIWRDTEGKCHFTNDSIFQSVLSTMATEDPLFVAKFARLNHILKYMVINSSDSESKYISLKPLPSALEALVKRFKWQIKGKNYSVLGERLFFNQPICEALVIHCIAKNEKQNLFKQFIDTKDEKGKTMVNTAAMFNNTTAVDVLVTNHADVAIADCRGRTPLHYLCGAAASSPGGINHRVDTVCIQLVINKDPSGMNRSDETGRTPLDYLCERHGEERDLIEQLESAMK